MPSRNRRISVVVALVAVLAVTAGCVRIERSSFRSNTLPSELLGEWTGTWTSSASAQGGAVLLTVQTFHDEPVLYLDTQHPCLVGGNFEFSQTGLTWRLMRDGETVFEAQLDLENRKLLGSYDCSADIGTWDAQWSGELPEIPDLGGTWAGSYLSFLPQGNGSFTMQLEQRWVDGLLRLDGTLTFDELAVTVPVTDGYVIWRGDTFEMVLRSVERGPTLVMQGYGDRGDFTVDDGLMVVDHPGVPFELGLWHSVWLGP